MATHRVFITGGTGYIGQRLIPLLLERGHPVQAMVRPGSERKLPDRCTPVVGDALDARSFVDRIGSADTFVQLVGTPHPSPAKAAQFRAVDLASVRASVAAAVAARVAHFVYVSVAHPAPMMRAYIEVRSAGEALIRSAGLGATILRPWYVLGPGHWWPYALLPAYWIFERLPATRAGARRLGLVTLHQMLGAMVEAVEQPATSFRIWEVPDIRLRRRASTVPER